MTGEVYISREKAITILQQLIRIRTSQPSGDERDAVTYISSLFPDDRVEKRIINHGNNRASLIITIPGEDRSRGIAISGHLDTIPVGDVREWTHSPFGAEIVDDVVYGRGAADMKGGVTSIIFTALSILKAEFKPAIDIRFCFTADEEVGGIGASALIGGGFLNSVEEVILVKPTNEKIGLAERGAVWLRVKSLGKSSHAAMTGANVNALSVFNSIAEKITELFNGEKKHDLLGHSTCVVTSLQAESDLFNVVPHCAIGTLDIRTLPSVDHDWLLQEIYTCVENVEKLNEGIHVSVEVVNNRPPVGMDEEAPLVQSLKGIYSDLDIPWEKTGLNYFTDASILIPSLGVPFVILGPGDDLFFHQPDEYVRIDSVIRVGEVLTQYVKSRK
jgi:succinyl-diaminopimelate desuccinylase